jgi:hypothetical protein
MTCDFLFLGEEPASITTAAAAQLQRAGIVREAVSFPCAEDEALQRLRASGSDAVLMYSPYQFSGFMMRHGCALRALGKPLISYVSEWTFGNPFRGYAAFEEADEWADFYACAQASDAAAFTAAGRKAAHFPLWVATDVFNSSTRLSERVKKLCFVGHVGDYVPGMYAERRRILAALHGAGLVDILNIPRSPDTAHLVAEAFGRYAGVLCPPSNGRNHSVRVFEAAACGAAIVECQEFGAAGPWFHEGSHRLSVPDGTSAEDWCALVSAIQWPELQHMASNAQRHCREYFTPEAVVSVILAHALNR